MKKPLRYRNYIVTKFLEWIQKNIYIFQNSGLMWKTLLSRFPYVTWLRDFLTFQLFFLHNLNCSISETCIKCFYSRIRFFRHSVFFKAPSFLSYRQFYLDLPHVFSSGLFVSCFFVSPAYSRRCMCLSDNWQISQFAIYSSGGIVVTFPHIPLGDEKKLFFTVNFVHHWNLHSNFRRNRIIRPFQGKRKYRSDNPIFLP